MRKLIRRLKDNGNGDDGKTRKRGGPDVNVNVVGVNANDDFDAASAKYPVDPNHRPPPQPSIKASNTNPVEPSPSPGPQDEVGTFSGFDSWLTSFATDPQQNTGATELPVETVEKFMLVMEGFPPAHYIDVVLSDVRKASHANTFEVCIHGPWYMTLKQVSELLKENQFEPPLSAKHAVVADPAWDGAKAFPDEFQILAVDGESCYDIDAPTGLLISKDEPIGRFNNTLRRLKIQCQDGKVLATSFPAQLEISFIRTLRLPENSAVVDQPAGLGHIPVSNIACVKKKLENSGNPSLVDMARKGGVFFPMYQREAMFMSFKTTIDAFAVRPFVGGVNAVSGLPWSVPASQRSTKQDYIAAPPQKFVDGITVAQDTVKQFIAMPLGSEYSVEKQVTGKEDVGGIQLEIVPGNQWRVSPPGIAFGLEDTPRGLQTEVVVLSWKDLSVDEKPVAGMDKSVSYWIQDHRPVYMRHLYHSQLSVPFGNGHPVGTVPWAPGARVSMKAVYPLNITVTYTDHGANRTKSVEWLPWWTAEKCMTALAEADVRISSQDPRNGTFKMMHESRQLGARTLQEEGVKDHAIISILSPWDNYSVPAQPAPAPVYPSGSPSPHQPPAQHHPTPPQPPQPQEQPTPPGPATFDSYGIDYGPSSDTRRRFRFSLNLFPQRKTKSAASGPRPLSYAPPAAFIPPPPQMAPASPYQPSPMMYQQLSPVAHHPQQASGEQYSAPVDGRSYESAPAPAPAAATAAYPAPISGSYSSPSYESPPYRLALDEASQSPMPDTSAAASPDYSSPSYSSPDYASPGYSSPTYSSPPYPSSRYSPPMPQQPQQQQSAAAPASQAYSSPNTWNPYSPPSAPSQPPTQYYSLQQEQAQSAYQAYSPPSAPSQASYSAYSPSAPSSATTYHPPRRSDSTSNYSSPSPVTPSHTPAPKPQSKIDQVGWAMGLAAGSRIHQIVHKDPFSQSAWCKARGTMLSVQILNAVAFETLTGMLAPPTPITPELYKQKGLPFYESYGEAAATHDPHESVGIKSVGEIDALEGNINLGATFNGSTKVGCTCCGKMLCDSIIRPCNHTFCSSCIGSYMTTYDKAVFCRICNTRATKLVGFSAPMALPGEDRVDFSDVKVITNKPAGGAISFFSIYELDAGQDGPQGGTHGSQNNDAFAVIYEMD